VIVENVVVILLIIGIFVWVLYNSPPFKESEENVWESFVAANNLTFRPGHLSAINASAYGEYRGHRLELDTTYGPNRDTKGRIICTRALLHTKRTSSGKSLNVLGRLDTQDVLSALVPNGLPDLRGELEAGDHGQWLSYEESGLVKETERLQLICNLLSDMADGYPAVAAAGGAIAPALQTIARENCLLRNVTIAMLKDIAQATRDLASRAEQLLCMRCLAHFYAHRADLPGQPDVTYYGCRTCHQSLEFIECPQVMVAVLDAGWHGDQDRQDESLRVNWLARRALFDFDRVEIVRAIDKDVEQLAMQIGNDTDPVRKPRYATMRCVVDPACGLSENTLRILENTFGQVEMLS
jgi:hypothetical protein